MKGSKTPTVIAVTTLVVAALAATPIGQAAGRFVLAKNSVGTPQLKKNAVTSVKVKNGSLLAADFKLGQLPAGPQGPQGPKGDAGAAGTAVAYAHVVVTSGGVAIDASRSKGIGTGSVTRVSQGITCISGLPSTPKSVAVTTDAETGAGILNATAALAPDAGVVSLCGGNGQVAVITGQGNTAMNSSYYLVLN
jgi:hypothetical protein